MFYIKKGDTMKKIFSRIFSVLTIFIVAISVAGCDTGSGSSENEKTNDSSISTVKTDSNEESEETTSKKETKPKKTTTKNEEVDDESDTSKETQKHNSITVPEKEETKGNLVWVPVNGGTKYHSNSGCSKMKDPIQVTKETAEKKRIYSLQEMSLNQKPPLWEVFYVNSSNAF